MDKPDINKERLQLALEAAGLDLWENDLITGEVTRKATAIFKELGYSGEESLAYLDNLFAIIHPDDIPTVRSALDDHLKGVTSQYRCEFRVRSKSGTWVWYANYGKIMDRKGEAHGRHFIGVTFNIDDRKRAEERSKSIIEAVPVPLALSDENGNIVYLNGAFTRLMGYTKAEIPDLASWWQLAYPDPQYREWMTDAWQKKTFEAERTDKPTGNLETRIVCKDGMTRTFLASPAAVEGFDGLHLAAFYDITERNTMERALRFRQIGLDRAGEIILWVDKDGHILDGNETACDKLGYSQEELSSLTIADIDPLFPFETWPAHWQELKRNHIVRLESMQKCKGGTTFPTEVIANYFEYEGREYNCALVADITERNAAQSRIKRLTDIYKALSEVNQALVRMETEETLFPLICKMAVDFGGLKMAWIGLRNAATGLIDFKSIYGEGSDYVRQISISTDENLPEGQGPSGIAFRENRTVIVNDFLASPLTTRWHEAANHFDWKSSGSFPIPRNGKPFAVLTVYHNEKNAFDEEMTTLLEEMVRDVSFALDSFDRESMRRKIQANLNASEQHFRAYFERSMVGMAATSASKGMLEVNDALCKMLGYSKEELMRKSWADLTHKDDLEVNEDLFGRVLQGTLDEYELDKRFIRKDGEIVYVHIAVRAVRNEEGKVDYFVAIINDVTDARSKQRELEQLAHYDKLTGLPNRALLNDRLEMGLAQAKRTRGSLAVCFMDLDGFKPVNDTYGHETGDALLIEISKRILSISRATDTVARLGGDEFVLLFPEISGEDECRHMLERIMDAIRQPLHVNGNEIQISASIGIAIYPEDVNDGESLIRHADQAMYIAKQMGRNRMHFFDAANDQLAQLRSEGLSRVAMALDHDELVLYYQPKVDMKSGRVVGMEALIRWLHPQRGLIPPVEFLPLIENSDFEIRLSEWVIKTAMAQLISWQKEGIRLSVSVNLPARHLQSHGFSEFIASTVSKHQELDANTFELEVLESAALGDMGAAIQKMRSCIAQGIHFSIDDFGTGYASLAYLRRLPARTIKIDQVFVSDMLDDEDDLSIVEGVISLARAFKKEVIAEGVETVEHGVRLLNFGCHLAQGYGIARPMEAALIPDWVRNYQPPAEWLAGSSGASSRNADRV